MVENVYFTVGSVVILVNIGNKNAFHFTLGLEVIL